MEKVGRHMENVYYKIDHRDIYIYIALCVLSGMLLQHLQSPEIPK